MDTKPEPEAEERPTKRIKLEVCKTEDITKLAKSSRWFSFNITSTDYLIMERKTLPQHLQALENCDVPVTLQSLINDMEDLGEVKLELSHHERDADGAWKCVKPLVFVLDELVDDQPEPVPTDGKKEKKRKKGTTITGKNFGAFTSISALKNATNVFLAWLDTSNTKGGKVIMPIRPVICLKHQMEVNNETVCLV
ncbi:unnamed protein product [Durusdinium trenchii]|uniref:Uncharacterized protein n=1 Tax=Durusdinium trenchii TaxID=1381693 RepID=A0ABP0JLK6_9DINO